MTRNSGRSGSDRYYPSYLDHHDSRRRSRGPEPSGRRTSHHRDDSRSRRLGRSRSPVFSKREYRRRDDDIRARRDESRSHLWADDQDYSRRWAESRDRSRRRSQSKSPELRDYRPPHRRDERQETHRGRRDQREAVAAQEPARTRYDELRLQPVVEIMEIAPTGELVHKGSMYRGGVKVVEVMVITPSGELIHKGSVYPGDAGRPGSGVPPREEPLARNPEAHTPNASASPWPLYTGEGSAGQLRAHSIVNEAMRKGGHGLYSTRCEKIAPLSTRPNVGGNINGVPMSRKKFLRLQARLSRPAGGPPSPPAGPHPDKVCDACKIPGHSVRICLWTSSEGDLPACPFCERYSDHLPEDCPERADFTDEDIWWYFVCNHRGKSHIRTRDPALMWPNVVRARHEELPDEMPLLMYPHSREFAAEEWRQKPDRYRVHNYCNEPVGLVPDPRTSSRDGLVKDDGLTCYPPAVSGDNDLDAERNGLEGGV